MEPLSLSSVVAQILVEQLKSRVTSAAWTKIRDLIGEKLNDDPDAAAVLERAAEAPEEEGLRAELTQAVFDVVISDSTLSGKLEDLIGEAAQEDRSETGQNVGREAGAEGNQPPEECPDHATPPNPPGESPVRGFPGLTVAATTQLTTAGSAFSIFVLVQNPFDVPITLHQVQTHIPVELVDVNRAAIRRVDRDDQEAGPDKPRPSFWRRLTARHTTEHVGVATAVGTDFGPEAAEKLFHSRVTVQRDLLVAQGASAHFAAASFVMPPGADADMLDAVMRRVASYTQGSIPVRLQPGDSVVRQFVLKTRSRLFFRPLSYTFQIQANYAVDGVDHIGTIPYHLNIQAPLSSVTWGALAGAALGTLIKSFAAPDQVISSTRIQDVVQALVVSLMASFVIVVAFARKTSAQPLVSIEDFWGGMVVGFSVGYFGFNQFLHLFSPENTTS